MGFFRRFKRSEEAVPEIHIDDVRNWVSGSLGAEIDAAKGQSKELCNSVSSSIESIKASVEGLESTKFEAEDKKYAIVNMSKETFVKKAKALLKPGVEAEGLGYEEMVSLKENAQLLFNELQKISPKQAFLMSNYFGKESREFAASLKGLGQSIESLGKFISTDAGVLKLEELVNERTKARRDSISLYGLMDERIAAIKGKIEALEAEERKKRLEMEELLNQKDWERARMLEEDIRSTDSRILEIESKIRNELSVLERPAKKLEHYLEKSQDLGLQEKQLVRKVASSPFDSLVAGEDLSRAIEILNSAKQEIDLKPKEEERLLELKRRLDSDLAWMRQNHSKLTEQQAKQKQSLSSILPGLSGAKRRIEAETGSAERHVQEARKELEEAYKDKKRTEEEIRGYREEFESLILQHAKKKVVVRE